MIIIYKITNIINNKIYIGQTKKSLNRRLREHLSDSKRKTTRLSNAINKYGIENFKIEELISGKFTILEADVLETKYIKELDSRNTNIGYNIKEGGNSVPMSEETKKKISENNRGTIMPPRNNYKDSERYSKEKLKEVLYNRSISHQGSRNIKSKPLRIDGVKYDTIKDAANSLGINWKTLSKKLKNIDGTNIFIRVAGVTKTFTIV